MWRLMKIYDNIITGNKNKKKYLNKNKKIIGSFII